MKKINFVVYGTSLLMLFAFGHPAKSQDNNLKVTQESDEQGETVKSDTDQQQYKRKVDDKLAEFRDRLRKLKDQANRAGGKAKTELREAAEKLDRKMSVAKEQFEKFKSASARTWEKAKLQMDAAMKDLERTYDEVIARFRKSNSREQG